MARSRPRTLLPRSWRPPIRGEQPVTRAMALVGLSPATHNLSIRAKQVIVIFGACYFGGPFVDRRRPAIFIADSLGLDFLNSIATPVDTPVDWLDSGDGLLRWLAQAKLVPDEALEELKARAMPGELDKVADQARALR